MEPNTIICGDCLSVLPTLPDNSFDLIINDPPNFGVVRDSWDNQWKNLDEYLLWSGKWLRECHRLLKDTGSIYVWGSIGEKSDSLLYLKILAEKTGFKFKDWITWKKQRGMGNRVGWLYTREEILWFVKSKKDFIWNEEAQYSTETRKSQSFGFSKWKEGYRPKSDKYRLTNVWTDIPEQTWNWKDVKTKHSTPKPVEALERMILSHTKEGDIVLDCFLGSGSTAVACAKNKRNFIGIEIDKDCCAISEERINYINKKV